MKTQEITTMNIPQIKSMMQAESFGNDVLVFSGQTFYDTIYEDPLRIDALAISLCTAGEAVVTVQGQKYNMAEGTMCIRIPGLITCWDSFSADYSGVEFIVSMDYLKSLPFALQNITAVFAYLRHEPCFQLSGKEQEDFRHIFLLTEGLAQNGDYYKSQSLQGIVVSALYFICDLTQQQETDFTDRLKNGNGYDRKQYYLLTFLDLLGKCSYKERSVTFYADKMFITPKHLSTVIKEASGKSAAEWIDEYVLTEAKALLQHSEANISETAYQLNFPNASFFGRYFKKHMGMSPGDYRKKLAFH